MRSQLSALLKIETVLVKISAVRARGAINRIKLQILAAERKTPISVKQITRILHAQLNLSRVNLKDEAVVKAKTTATSKIPKLRLLIQPKLTVRAVMTNRRHKDVLHLSELETTISDVVDQDQMLPQKAM
jgi:hypothetical protein